ncbi:MAG: peptidylprolyl isomerase [Anaerolineae bacterium]|nr:peptidylprolyl isomerase [Anaerolineae bacterium]
MATQRNKKEEKRVQEDKTRKEQHLAREEAKHRNLLLMITAGFGIVIALVLIIGLVDALWVTPNKVIARVGDEEITVKEFQTQSRYYRWNLLNEYVQINQLLGIYQMIGDTNTYETQLQRAQNITMVLDQPELLAPETLNLMIEDIIIKNKAAELGITIEDDELAESLQESFGFFPDGTPTPKATVVVNYPTLSAEQGFLVTATPNITEIAATQQAVATEFAMTQAAGEEESEAESTPTPTAEPLNTPTPADSSDENQESLEAEVPTPVPTATVYTIEVYEDNYEKYLDTIWLAKIDEDAFLENQRMSQLRTKVFEAITADIPTTEEQVWARHILTNDITVAESVLGTLESGEMSFDQLARMFSSDSSAESGGDLGWFGRGIMVAEFEEAAFSLTEIGQISDIVETQFGYHVIQLLGRDEVTYSEQDLNTKKQNFFTNWLTEQRNSMVEQGLLLIDEQLRDRHAPSQPSFNDPAVFEALFGISQRDSRRTSAAYETEQAGFALTPSATAEAEE